MKAPLLAQSILAPASMALFMVSGSVFLWFLVWIGSTLLVWVIAKSEAELNTPIDNQIDDYLANAYKPKRRPAPPMPEPAEYPPGRYEDIPSPKQNASHWRATK